MKRRIYVDGNTVYGIDEECLKKKREEKGEGDRELDALWQRYLREIEREGRENSY